MSQFPSPDPRGLPAPGPAGPAAGPATATAPAPRQRQAPPAGQDAATEAARANPPTARKPALSTPAWLRRVLVIAVTACAVLAVASTGLLASDRSSVTALQANVTQLLRIQSIQASLLDADVAATNAFLGTGADDAAQLAIYDAAMARASAEIVTAGRAQPADAEALAALNQQVVLYAEAIEAARVNNRQGFQVGTAYLSDGSDALRTETMPIIQRLLEANNDRIDAEISNLGGLGLVLAILALAAPVTMVVLWIRLARRFRRYVNVPFAAATVAATMAAVTLLASVGASMAMARELADHEVGALSQVSSAKGAAADAKSYESLRLIEQSARDSHEESWAASAEEVESHLTGEAQALQAPWQDYVAAHQAIVEADTGGDWSAAVEIATTGQDSGSNALFGRFIDAANALVDELSVRVDAELSASATWLGVAAVLTGLLGVTAAVLAAVGVNQRMKEFV
ncbi:hypothetical protein ACF3NT_06645 [Naumannella halotolerans]|uniref:Uncharacterized protein n=1 Tax=Naumannella halotolerans TaxID=993414 RepID=A0A4R7J8S1_9ACTN|nr:hypothetical protein [Naumannella halotolerans]TDT33715.1 hypothetical protein CLV29_1342 [Naumannella halotolerans]